MQPFPETSSLSKSSIHNKSYKFVRHNTVERQTNLVEVNIFKRKMTLGKARINSLKRLQSPAHSKRVRKYTEFEEQLFSPQSPLKLSPFRQYESKLKLSAESWVIHDMKTNAYKRGWKPNKVSSYNGLFRVIVLLCYTNILKENSKLKLVKIKINQEHLKESKIKISKKEANSAFGINGKKIYKTFSNGSIVYLIDVVKSMIVSGNQDLYQYCVIYCGYLLYHTETESNLVSKELLSFGEKKEEFYADKFCTYCDQTLFKSLGLQNSWVQNSQEGYELFSTPNQICQILIKGLKNEQFFKTTVAMQKHFFSIRFQVGYNYWQDRSMTIKAPRQKLKNEHFCCLVYKGAKNYEALCYNSDLDILMVIEDSKFLMADLDIQVLENWYVTVTKPVVSKHKLSIESPTKRKISLFPVLEISRK